MHSCEGIIVMFAENNYCKVVVQYVNSNPSPNFYSFVYQYYLFTVEAYHLNYEICTKSGALKNFL